jgi:hypothetical protein
MLILLALTLLTLTACMSPDPTGPVVNNSGDGNIFNIPGKDADHNDVVTPAPVIVPPVIVTPPGESPS